MEEVVKFLRENPVQYLATVGRDGKAKCRPFMFAGEQGGKLWFCTNSTKEVYKDMQANPYVEVSVSSPACASRTPSSRASIRRRTTRSLRCSIWRTPAR